MFEKFSIIALCAFITLLSADNDLLEKAADKCLQKTKLDKHTIDEFMLRRPVQTDCPMIKCYFKCLMQETKWMDDEGYFNDKPELASDEDYVSFGQQCKRVTGADVCEKAFNFHKCIVEKMEGQ